MNTVLIILVVAFSIAFLLILGSSLLTSAWIFSIFRRGVQQAQEEQSAEDAAAAHRGRVLDLVAKLPAGTEAYKCRNCGAIVDSTAELSPRGEVKCNYCNAWTSIYQ